jgi:hypothetical protein
MQEEANEDEENQDEDSPPSKKTRTESLVLDDEEAKIASGLRESSRAASQLERYNRTQDGVSGMGEGDDEGSEQGGSAVDDYSGDGVTGFEDNEVCP